MAGLQVVVTKCDDNGNVDMADLQAQCEKHAANLACVMITYPSTHGVFETQVKELCQMVHRHGGRVRGRRQHERPGRRGRAGRVRRRREPPEPAQDLLHPARRRRPGVGPCAWWRTWCPSCPAMPGRRGRWRRAVSAAPFGNAAVLPISWMYIRMMGAEGLTPPPRPPSSAPTTSASA
jgi:glycine dehydrogenase